MKLLLLGKGGQVGWELQRSLAPLGRFALWTYFTACVKPSVIDLGGSPAHMDARRGLIWAESSSGSPGFLAGAGALPHRHHVPWAAFLASFLASFLHRYALPSCMR